MAWIAVVALVSACSSDADPPVDPDPDPDPAPDIALVEVASGLQGPLGLTSPPGDDRLFIVEQVGRIRIVRDGQVLARPFLDLTGQVSGGNEQGLLGLAFHPGYEANGRFFVSFTDPGGTSMLLRYQRSDDPDVADPSTATELLRVPQPFSNHNGGHVTFGPDGMLYLGLGDGGSGGDPLGNGQNTNTLLGTILRLDVDGGDPFRVPPDNPFADGGGRGEIWHWGLRNPWRFSFDADDGSLYIGDVGQANVEEIDVAAPGRGGLNFGWAIFEGSECFAQDGCDSQGLEGPVLEYTHDDGCSVTGGYVYRGGALPDLVGHYLYSDFCGGWIRSFRFSGGQALEQASLLPPGEAGSVTAFGEDAEGELYVLNAAGRVLRIEPAGG